MAIHCSDLAWRIPWTEELGRLSPCGRKEPDTTEPLSISQRAQGFPGGSDGKESSCKEEDLGSIPGLGRSPGEGKATHSSTWPGEFHGLYSPRGHKESDVTE